MNFTRLLLKNLHEWKISSIRKPLILRGARQVGKTTLVKEFSKSYKYSIFLNLEKNEDKLFFENFADVKAILEALCIAKNIPSKSVGETLLFIDEIQESPKTIQLLRYFYEEIPELHVISAGSLLEFSFRYIQSFPVGRVEFLYLNPLNFQEYLSAIEHESALEYFNQIPIKPVAHITLLSLFHRFAIVGGMPEVLKTEIKSKNIADLPKIYESIWSTYQNDIEKYASNETDRKVTKHIITSAHLNIDERIKFQNFGNSNYRSREVGESFRHLEDAKIIQLIYPTTQVQIPIKPDIKKSPRLQILDTGLLNYTLGIQASLLALKDLSSAYKGAIIPHLITQELLSLNSLSYHKPNFWVREKKQSNSKVDLVYPYKNKVIPIEIKSGSTGTLKSLHQFMDATDHSYAIRIYGGVFRIEESITQKGTRFLLMNLPYYLGTKIPEYVEWFVETNKID